MSFYLVGFAEEVQQTFFKHTQVSFHLIASVALAVITVIALLGAKTFAKINHLFFVIQFGSIFIGFLSILFRGPMQLTGGGQFTGLSTDTLKENMNSSFTSELDMCGKATVCDLPAVYAIIFPLATGFMEGLNLSGDLATPGKSIPVGTLAAFGTSCCIYLIMIFSFASAYPGSTLRTNITFLQQTTISEYLVVIGLLFSCFSSGLGSLFGASRILQAISRDKLFKIMAPLGYGTEHGDEPRLAVLFTWLIAQICIFIGDLDAIAPICTSFYCLAYAAVNFACLILHLSGVPNFRPTFSLSNWPLALSGVVLNLSVMFYLNPAYAAISLLVLSFIFGYLYLMTPSRQWGDVSQALIFHQVRKYLLRLDERKTHAKFWRPSIVLFIKSLVNPTVSLCDQMKKGGLYVVADVIVGEFGYETTRLCEEKRPNIKRFPRF